MGSILGGPFDVRMFSRIRRALNTRRASCGVNPVRNWRSSIFLIGTT
ncbi:hypothetical protein HMPREF0004_4587 [Achromobacter piechaudii ATCC 43553]|uniref:Uncharacterized protein n=1 Tax=Achromobacter piechaudii ATCC 43553 TaxID=742159 RepID=D4XGJ0_9BURK|nr:hypothetical protein HMPREF0004_4587 [Achromobacter piechaudii ATCC 43553]